MKNKITKSIAAAAIIGLAITCLAFKGDQNNRLSKTERANGWQLLFNGHSTTGWHLYNSTEGWRACLRSAGQIGRGRPGHRSGIQKLRP